MHPPPPYNQITDGSTPKKGGCCVCSKSLNEGEGTFYDRGKFGKMRACSSECREKLAQKLGNSDQKFQQLEKDIQMLKNELSFCPPEKRAEIEAKIKKFEKELAELSNGNPTNGNQGSETDNTEQKDNSKPPANPGADKPKDEKTTTENIKSEQNKKENEYNENLNRAGSENATLQEKAEAVKKSGFMVGQETSEQTNRRERLERELAEKDTALANQAFLGCIENNLQANNLTLQNLPAEIQADYEKNKNNVRDMVAKINDIIGKMGAEKRFAEAKKSKNKELLLKIIHSKNKYDQPYKKEVQSLLKQLENQQNQSSVP